MTEFKGSRGEYSNKISILPTNARILETYNFYY